MQFVRDIAVDVKSNQGPLFSESKHMYIYTLNVTLNLITLHTYNSAKVRILYATQIRTHLHTYVGL